MHFFRSASGVAAGLMLAAAPLSLAVPAAAAAKTVQPAQAPRPDGLSIADFYAARGNAPLWLSPAAGSSAQDLVALLESAKTDGLDPGRYGVEALKNALGEAWGGKKKPTLRADIMLSQAFVAYASDLTQDPDIGIIYVDPQLRPRPLPARLLLDRAAAAPSLTTYVRKLGWMNPMYGTLRQALAGHDYADDHQRQLLVVNLERARALPANERRYVVVNSAAQRLSMFENGREVDSMRVVVGKTKYPTPMMSALIRYASLNPYWFVPPDLATERIAPNVLKRGLGYLDELGYQVLSDWIDDPRVIDPKTVDWKGVADGKRQVYIRQLPGPHNSMGRMKFMFPNGEGVYLHDNPERELFEQAARLYSGGCVRLEDAARLARWMFGRDLVWEGAGTEEKVPLANPVPVYITYLTAVPDGSSIAYFDDIYGRDKARLAARAGNGVIASR